MYILSALLENEGAECRSQRPIGSLVQLLAACNDYARLPIGVSNMQTLSTPSVLSCCYIVAVLQVFLVSGCVQHPIKGNLDSAQPSRQEVRVAALPAWVAEPPRDDAASMWGVGSGPDIDSAKRAALKNVAARLKVTVSAQLESRVTVSNQNVDKFARTRVSEDVQRTEFRNHRLERTAQSADGFYALVSVDRLAIVSDANQRLAAADREIARLLSGLDRLPPVERFINQQKALPWIEKAIAASQILLGLDTAFDGTRLRAYEVSLSRGKDAASELIFDVQANAEQQDVAQTLRGFLNQAGIRVGTGGAPLVLDVVTTQEMVFDSKTVKLKINVSVRDDRTRTISSREFSVSGSSLVDHKSAKMSALKQLGEQLRGAGLVAALGF